jgi:peptidyl-prolyl cis-trans isomerase C
MTNSRTPEEAEARAEEVRQKALAGANFADLALEYSDEPAAKTSKGSLGYFSRGKMVKEFENAAFALAKEGDISPVLKTRFGYHVIRLEGREPESVAPFSEVQDKLLLKQKQMYENSQFRTHIGSLREDKTLSMKAETIEKLKLTLPAELRIKLQEQKKP